MGRYAILIACVAAALSGCAGAPPDPRADFDAVAGNVVRSAKQACAQAPAVDRCDFQVVRLADRDLPPNAWQTRDADGRPLIVVTEAMVRATEGADELAFVLAHEAAHHVADHRDRALADHGRRLGVLLGLAPAGDAPPAPDPVALELEADALGARIAADAGYDPRRAAGLFDRGPFRHPVGDASSHPSGAARKALLLR